MLKFKLLCKVPKLLPWDFDALAVPFIHFKFSTPTAILQLTT